MGCRNCFCSECRSERRDRRESRRREALFWVESYKKMGILENNYRIARIARLVGQSDKPVRRCGAVNDWLSISDKLSRCTKVLGHATDHSLSGYTSWV